MRSSFVGISNAIAAGLLVVGLIVGAFGFYVATNYQTKASTSTPMTTQSIATTSTKVISVTVTESASGVQTVFITSTGLSTVTQTVTASVVQSSLTSSTTNITQLDSSVSIQSAVLSYNASAYIGLGEFPVGAWSLTFVLANSNAVPITGLGVYLKSASNSTFTISGGNISPIIVGAPRTISLTVCANSQFVYPILCGATDGNYIVGDIYSFVVHASFADGTTAYVAGNATVANG